MYVCIGLQAIYFSVKAQKIYKHYKRKVDSDSGEITQVFLLTNTSFCKAFFGIF